jgi:hypothetical protein
MYSQIVCAFTSTLEHSRNTWDLDLVGTVLKAWHSRLQGERREERNKEGIGEGGVEWHRLEERGKKRREYSDTARGERQCTQHTVASPPCFPQ